MYTLLKFESVSNHPSYDRQSAMDIAHVVRYLWVILRLRKSNTNRCVTLAGKDKNRVTVLQYTHRSGELFTVRECHIAGYFQLSSHEVWVTYLTERPCERWVGVLNGHQKSNSKGHGCLARLMTLAYLKKDRSNAN